MSPIHSRICPSTARTSPISNLDYLKLGVCRCMSAARSGNDFLQTYRKNDGSRVLQDMKFTRLSTSTQRQGLKYRYLTNEKNLPAWVIVLLYKYRWDIEKTFDETKTKLEEKQSWASSKNAKKMHAHFICLTHNLMLLLTRPVTMRHYFRAMTLIKGFSEFYCTMTEMDEKIIL